MVKKKKKNTRLAVYECTDCGAEFSFKGEHRDCPECGGSNRELVGYDDEDEFGDFDGDDIDGLDEEDSEEEFDEEEFEEDDDDEDEDDEDDYEPPSRKRKRDDDDW